MISVGRMLQSPEVGGSSSDITSFPSYFATINDVTAPEYVITRIKRTQESLVEESGMVFMPVEATPISCLQSVIPTW